MLSFLPANSVQSMTIVPRNFADCRRMPELLRVWVLKLGLLLYSQATKDVVPLVNPPRRKSFRAKFFSTFPVSFKSWAVQDCRIAVRKR